MKRGLSTIVSTLLILLLVFVAVGILWVVVRNVIQGGTEQVSLGKFTLDLAIEKVTIAGNTLSVKVKRNPGAGTFTGLNFILDDGDDIEVVQRKNLTMEEYSIRTFQLTLQEMSASNVKTIGVAPIFTLESGREVTGDIKDTYIISKDTGTPYVSPVENCGNGLIDAEEDCDGTNISSDDTCISEHYDGGELLCAIDCSFDYGSCALDSCPDGTIDTGTEQCDCDADASCTLTELNSQTCSSHLGTGYSGILGCSQTSCQFDTSGCSYTPTCGDSLNEIGEQCDDGDTSSGDGCSSTCTIESGWTCTGGSGQSSCTEISTQECGNNLIEGTEVCDGTDLGEETCTSQMGTGYTGTLSCESDCSFDYGSCVEDYEEIIEGAYYVSTSGSDSNPGTYEEPFLTWQKGFDEATAGDTVYIRGGIYYPGNERFGVSIDSKSGNDGSPICIFAYPGETPILDCSNLTSSSEAHRGVRLSSSDFWHLKGLEVTNVKQVSETKFANGFFIYNGNNNIIEQCNAYEVQGVGIRIQDDAEYNLILNCDSYDNYDPLSLSPGGNADGIQICYIDDRPGNKRVNTIRGCRAWNNSDDGFDFWKNEGIVLVDSCWSFNNGYDEGDGTGFKFGSTDIPAVEGVYQRVIRNCIASGNYHWGFFSNTADVYMKLQNCIAYKNHLEGIHFGTSGRPIIKNCVSYDNDGSNFVTNANVVDEYNDWNLVDVTVTDDDFVSVDTSLLRSPRQADGSLPDIDFFKPVEDSDLIDAGTNVGLPYDGSASDLGVFEYWENTPIKEVDDDDDDDDDEDQPEVINENKSPMINNQIFNIFEENDNLFIGSITASDPDDDQQIAYNMISNDYSSFFTINNNTGELSLIDYSIFNSAINQKYQISIIVTDDGTPSLSDTAVITVNAYINNKTIYIDPSNQNNKIQDGSHSNPYSSWDNVELLEGTIYLQKKGTIAQLEKLTIINDEIEIDAYGEGTNPVMQFKNADYGITIFNSKDISFRNIKLICENMLSGIYLAGSNDDITIENCYFEGTADGIRITNEGNNVQLKRNTFQNNNTGVLINKGSVELLYNRFVNNSTAIYTVSEHSMINIINNVFNSYYKGIYSNGARLIVFNNIFNSDIPNNESFFFENTTFQSDNNIFHPVEKGFIYISPHTFNVLSDYQQTSRKDLNSIDKDPEFINADDLNFKLKSTSPAINNGRFIDYGTDFFGNFVPQLDAPDIGVFEYISDKKLAGEITDEYEKTKNKIKMYPNPSNDGIINIAIEKTEIDKVLIIDIYNTYGQLVYQKILSDTFSTNELITLNLSDKKQGIYIVKLRNDSKSQPCKIILSH